MRFERPEALLLALLALPELLLTLRRATRLRASLEALVGPARRARAGARFAAASVYGGIAAALFIVSTSLALAGPAWGRRGAVAERSGAEVALVLDLSRSMEVRDGSPTRLDDAKNLIRSLLRSLGQARETEGGCSFSLTAVKGDALLLVPMTEDIEALDQALEYAGPEIMTAKGTQLGRGIETALASYASRGAAKRLILLFSDGGDLSGSARAAAAKAAAAGARLVAVGLGGSDPGPVPAPIGLSASAAGGSESAGAAYIADAQGRPAESALDAAFMRALAAAGEGRYLEGAESSTTAALVEEVARARSGGAGMEYEVASRGGLFALLAYAFLTAAVAAGMLGTRGGRR